MANEILVQFNYPEDEFDLRFVRIRFKAEVVNPAGPSEEEITLNDRIPDDPTAIERLQISLPVNDLGHVLITDDLNTELVINEAWIESHTGEALQRLDIGDRTIADMAGSGSRFIDLEDKVVEWLRPREVTPSRLWNRAGMFVVLGQAEFDFSEYRLFAAPINADEGHKLREGLDIDSESSGNWLTMTDPDASALEEVRFHLGEVGFDGRFSVELIREGHEIGWAWLLAGPRTAVGFRADNPKIDRVDGIAILLPRDFKQPSKPEPGNRAGRSGHSGGSPPLHANEAQIIDHAELFSDDPGPFCQPFKNPERILGERRFTTILRVDQPEIAAAAGVKAKRLRERFEAPIRGIFDVGVDEDERELITENLSGDSGRSMPNFSDMWTSPLAREQRRRGRKVPSGTTMIDWESDSSENQAVTVARGHLLEWRVRWRSNGYSLGNVAHSLTLAPRQVKRIMKVDWERRERARRNESLEIDDNVLQTTESSRDYSDAVTSELSEWSRGSSHSSTTGAAAGAGFAMGGFVIGGGVSHGSAKASSEQAGERNVSASEEQKLRDAIRQYGESVRSLESTVITELEQEETVEAVSETIANPNFCHSLTVVYYDILRHLRVDTELGGVSECLFVPFSITPFADRIRIEGRGDVMVIDRILRYRDTLKRYLRDRNLRWVFRYLDDYKRNYKDRHGNITVPDGPRTAQSITRLRGEIEIKLNLRSPLTGDEDKDALEELADEAATKARTIASRISVLARRFRPLSPLLGTTVSKVAGILAEKPPEEREVDYQREIAPDVARNFFNRLQLWVGQSPIAADFTMRGSYRQDGIHRVAFSVSANALEALNMTREQLGDLMLTSKVPLPMYSVADVTHARIRFSTEHYQSSSSTGPMHNDLVEIPGATEIDGQPVRYALAGEVSLEFPSTAWERQHLREQIETDIFQLVEHLESHRHYYHKAIWWNMDRDELYTLLDGYVISEMNHRSIASVAERSPIAVLGNTLVFRVARGASISNDPDEALDKVFARYWEKGRKSEPMRVSLPTGGLYAQALKDECNACEEHYGNTDWVLERDEISPQEFDTNLLSSRRSEPDSLTPTQLPESLINIQNAPQAPAPSGLQGALNAVTKGDSFRDMAGLAGTQANARAAMKEAASLARQFGNLASMQTDANRAAAERVRNSDLPTEDKQQLLQDLKSEEVRGEPMTDKQARHGKDAADLGYEYSTKSIAPDGTTTETDVRRPERSGGTSEISDQQMLASTGGVLARPVTIEEFTNRNAPKAEKAAANATALIVPPMELEDSNGEAIATPFMYPSRSTGEGRIFVVSDFGIDNHWPIDTKSPNRVHQFFLERWRSFVRQSIWIRVHVLGSSDSYGSPDYNHDLRLRRAESAVWSGIIPTSEEVLEVSRAEVPRYTEILHTFVTADTGRVVHTSHFTGLPLRMPEPVWLDNVMPLPTTAEQALQFRSTKLGELMGQVGLTGTFPYRNSESPAGRAANRSVLIWEELVLVNMPAQGEAIEDVDPQEQEENKRKTKDRFDQLGPDAPKRSRIAQYIYLLYLDPASDMRVIFHENAERAITDTVDKVDQAKLMDLQLDAFKFFTRVLRDEVGLKFDKENWEEEYVDDLRPLIDQLFRRSTNLDDIYSELHHMGDSAYSGWSAVDRQLSPGGWFSRLGPLNEDSPPQVMMRWIIAQMKKPKTVYTKEEVLRLGLTTPQDIE